MGTKFINSQNAISTDLLLWNERPTQVSIQETYNIKVWPITNILNDGPINFNVPPQPNGMMTDINVVTKFKIQHNEQDMTCPLGTRRRTDVVVTSLLRR